MTDRPPATDQNRFIFASLPGARSMLSGCILCVNRPTSPPPLSVVRRYPRRIPSPLYTLFLALLIPIAFGCGGAETSRAAAPGVPALGPESARALVVEFGDYQCGPCASMGRTLHALLEEHREDVRFVFRHCPSRAHPIGRAAAIVAAAAAEDGRFWELHWRLVEEGPLTSEEQIWRLVAAAGLDDTRLRNIIASGRPAAAVDRDLAEADRLGVRGMPTTFVGERRVEGPASFDRLLSIIGENSTPASRRR